MSADRLVIIGGSAAGSRAAKAALTAGFSGWIDVISREPQAPFYRPALSKQILGGSWTLERAAQPAAHGENVRWHVGRAAVELVVEARNVTLDDGSELAFDRLVLAGGCRPRSLAAVPVGEFGDANSVEGVERVRERVKDGGHAVVIGAGLIGSEVASTLLASGARVTLVDPSSAPLLRALGPSGNELCITQHRARGVDLRLGVGVQRVERQQQGVTVETDSGDVITADEAVVCVGVTPDTDWLSETGLPLLPDGGIACDSHLIVEGHEGVAAAGDIAAWNSARQGRRVRVEHWMTAIEQGAAAGRNVLVPPEERKAFDGLPTFWTEQHGKLIHVLGYHDHDSEWNTVEGSSAEDGLVLRASHSGRPTGYLLFNAPRRMGYYRQQLLKDAPTEVAS